MLTLSEAREIRGVAAREVAVAVGVSAERYARMEEDSSDMTIEQAEAACRAIGVPVDGVSFSQPSRPVARSIRLVRRSGRSVPGGGAPGQ